MKKILIVDNNRTIVEILSERLTEAGFVTSKAYDGLEALEVLKSDRPDVIVLDLIMPKIDGYRLSRYLRAGTEFNTIPIIILTGIAAEDSNQMFDVEADAFIAKGKIDDTFTHLVTTIRWLESRKTPIREIVGTENLYPREMTRELLLVKQHFDSMLQVMAEGVIEMDERHRILFANQAACTLLGIGEIELFGRPVAEVFPDAADLPVYMKSLPKTNKTRRPGIRIMRGKNILNLIATPFFFNQAYIGSIAVLEDVTTQVKKERALEELNRAIIENAPIGIALLDAERRIALSNGHFRRLSGVDGDPKGVAFAECGLFGSPGGAEILRAAEEARIEEPVSLEISFPSDGKKCPTYQFVASPLSQQNGRPYLLVLVEDVSENAELRRDLLAANRELETANQAKSNFLAIVSHELRTPLSVIRGYISLILDGKISGASGEALDALKTSDRRARHLQQLIEELLDISRIEAGKITLKNDILSLPAHVREIVELFQVDIERKKLDVSVTFPAVFPEIVADHDKIHQVLSNLVGNAVKFTPAGGRISIDGEADVDTVRVLVSDSGIGIPGDKIPQIFNKFYQVDSTDTRVHGGAGLGLAIVRMILEAMGGAITVRSEQGRGSTFTVTLPVGPVEKVRRETPETPQQDAVAAEDTGRRAILLCEDDDDTIQIIEYALRGAGHEIIVCRDCFTAIEMIWKRRIDLVMVDIRLPHMDGYDFCRILRATPTAARTPIIILSAAGQEEEIRKGYEAGANEYVIKPFVPQDLLAKIGRHLPPGAAG
jgi:PAS domain S-box-containing protein